ncbi:MAG: glycosyl hydrolase family 17 protein [Bacteroidota bacterium]
MKNPSTSLIGMGMQPFVGNCTNKMAPPWCGYSLADVKTLIQTLKTAGYTTIRTFGSGPWDGGTNGFQRGNVWNVQAASEVGGVSVWNCAALYKGNDSISNQQIDAAIQQAIDYPDVVLGIIVGVEPIGLQGYTVAEVVSFINYAKKKRDDAKISAAQLPITTSEQLGVLAGAAHKDVVKACDGVIFANYYPVLACGITIDHAISDTGWGLDAKYQGLRAQIDSYGLRDMVINIGETGWPTAGTIPTPAGCTQGVATTGSTNQETYIQNLSTWAAKQSPAMQVFLFEAYNEMWKAGCDTTSIDANWGVFQTPSGLNITPPYGACQTPHNPD